MSEAKHPATSRGRAKHVVALLVVPDAVALEVLIAQQILGPPDPVVAAITGNGESPYDVILCGEQPRHVLRAGTDLGELAALDVMLSADTVIVPGVENPMAPRSEALLRTLREAHEGGARMVGFCGGAFLLGHAGILDRRRATTHWIFTNEFRATFPHVRLEVDRHEAQRVGTAVEERETGQHARQSTGRCGPADRPRSSSKWVTRKARRPGGRRRGTPCDHYGATGAAGYPERPHSCAPPS